MIGILIILGIVIVGLGFGYLVIGPWIYGYKPFTTPKQAARGERLRK